MNDFVNAVDRALTALGLKAPHFVQLVCTHELHKDESIPTAAVGSSKIYINPEFFLAQSEKQRLTILAHEILHPCLEHFWRRGWRDPRMWNMAADHIINNALVAEGFEPIEGWLCDPKYIGWSEEKVYDDIVSNPPPKGNGGKCNGNGDDWGIGQDVKDETGTPEEQAKQREKIRGDIVKAFSAAKAQGAGKGILERLVDRITKPKEPWYDHLRKYMLSIRYDDYDWKRVNRREYCKTGLIFPDKYNESIHKIVEIVDTSGSISDRVLANFNGQTNKIYDDCKPENIVIIYADDGVQSVEEYTAEQMPVQLKPHGGGGTDFRPALDYVAKHHADADVVIYLTDLEGNCGQEQDLPVVWACVTDRVAPWGTTISIEEGV